VPSVSQAKNVMYRTLSAIVAPSVTASEVNALWNHFGASCAYCGVGIERSSRTGHIDHLEIGAGNGPRNRVLACAKCNGDEKREQAWRPFLAAKCADERARHQRVTLIEEWVAKHPAVEHALTAEAELVLREAEGIVEAFHAACTKLRGAVKKSRRSGTSTNES
jgi:hypothetical protein